MVNKILLRVFLIAFLGIKLSYSRDLDRKEEILVVQTSIEGQEEEEKEQKDLSDLITEILRDFAFFVTENPSTDFNENRLQKVYNDFSKKLQNHK